MLLHSRPLHPNPEVAVEWSKTNGNGTVPSSTPEADETE